MRKGRLLPQAAPAIFLTALLSSAALWRFSANPTETGSTKAPVISLRADLQPDQRLTAQIDEKDLRKCLLMYMELTGRRIWPDTNGLGASLDEATGGRLSRWKLVAPVPQFDSGISFHGDGVLSAAETKAALEKGLTRANLQLVPVGKKYFRIQLLPATRPLGLGQSE
jgi:hypothetical protein